MNKLYFALKLLIALAAGMGTTLAFAPFAISILAILCPAVLLLLWQRASPWRAALIGLSYGLGFFGTGTWWIYISMHEFGHMDPPLAMVAMIVVLIYEALFPALQGYVLARWTPPASTARSIVLFPCSWVLLEWVRSILFTGWHWLIIGYSQIDAPLGGYATIIGTYGISLLTLLTAGILVQSIITILDLKKSDQGSTKFTKLWRVTLKNIVVAIIWFNGVLIGSHHFTEENAKTLKISMIQGNIPQELKWQPEQFSATVEKYHKYTREHWDSDVIIWPEGAIPALSTVAEPFLDALDAEAKSHNSHVMLGIPVAEGKNYYNAVIMVGMSSGHYYKRHLVPFGEYTPLKSILNPIVTALNIPMSNFSSGPEYQPLLDINGIHLAAFICYEIVEPDEVRRSLNHAQLIVTINDDSWFDGSIAPKQHLQMARMRSLENGMPQLFLSSRGASAIIDSQGKIVHFLDEHKEGVITATVTNVHGKTPWRIAGSLPVLVLCLLGVASQLLLPRWARSRES